MLIHARKLAEGIVAAAMVLFAAPAVAQFPSKPIKIIVPFPAGSATDVVARILGQSVSNAIGQPVLIDNKAGADGAIGAADVMNSAPDGYTVLLATNSPMSAVPSLRKNPPFDPVTDFAPVTDVGRYTFFLYVNAALPFKTLGEMIAHAKSNPGKLNYGTGNATGIVSFAQIGSLAGIPPAVGFIAKLLVLALLVSAKLWWVLGAALLGVAIGIHYYFSILREAVVRPTEDGEEIVALELPLGTRALVFVLAAASILGGLFVLAGR